MSTRKREREKLDWFSLRPHLFRHLIGLIVSYFCLFLWIILSLSHTHFESPGFFVNTTIARLWLCEIHIQMINIFYNKSCVTERYLKQSIFPFVFLRTNEYLCLSCNIHKEIRYKICFDNFSNKKIDVFTIESFLHKLKNIRCATSVGCKKQNGWLIINDTVHWSWITLRCYR